MVPVHTVSFTEGTTPSDYGTLKVGLLRSIPIQTGAGGTPVAVGYGTSAAALLFVALNGPGAAYATRAGNVATVFFTPPASGPAATAFSLLVLD